ncbi:MAG: YitT family protein [Bacteroidota bacterium]
MNPLLSKILVGIATRRLQKKAPKKKVTETRVKPVVENIKVELSHGLKEFVFVILGVLSAGFGLKGFLLPNHFIDGGATGISLLIENTTSISLGILLVVVNTPFLLLATRTIGKRFALQSIVAIALLAVVVHLVDYPVVTEDKLLIAIFGGFFLGLGIGLSMRGGSVIDGTEVLAIFLSRKLGITIGDVLLLINIVIFDP